MPGKSTTQFYKRLEQALPETLASTVEAADALLLGLPLEAVAVSTSKGTIDAKKTRALREEIKEEEHQLEVFQGRTTTKKKKQQQRNKKAAKKSSIIMKLRVYDSGNVHCEVKIKYSHLRTS